MSNILVLLVVIAFASSCGAPSARMDCTLGDPEVICAEPMSSCNYNTRACQRRCTATSNCEAGQECQGGWCVACVAQIGAKPKLGEATCLCRNHSDCTSQFCDIYQITDTQPFGRCVPETVASSENGRPAQNILYVDRNNCLSGNASDGSKLHPYCEITQAVAVNVNEQRIRPIRVMPSATVYAGGIGLPGLPAVLKIVGPDSSESGEAIVEPPVILNDQQFGRSTDVTLEGIRIKNDVVGFSGISCTGKSWTHILRLRRVLISPIDQVAKPLAAVQIAGCRLEMDRTAIIRNRNNALILTASGTAETSFQITNSIISDNLLDDADPNAVVLAISPKKDPSDYDRMGVFRFNTVYNNSKSKTAPSTLNHGITCTGADFPLLSDSIVVDNMKGGGDGLQLHPNCRISNTTIQTQPQFSQLGDASSRKPENFQLADMDTVAKEKASTDKAIVGEGLFQYYYLWDFMGQLRPSVSGGKRDIGALEAPASK